MKKHFSAAVISLVALALLSHLSLAAMRWQTTNFGKVPVSLTYVDPISGKKVFRNFSGVFSNFLVMDLDDRNHHAFYLHTESRSGATVVDESATGSGVTAGVKTSVLATQGTPMSSNELILGEGLSLEPDALIMSCNYTRDAANVVNFNLKMTAAGMLDFFGQNIPGLVSLSMAPRKVQAQSIPDEQIGRDFVFANFSGIKPIAIDHNAAFDFGNSGTIDLTQGGASFQLDRMLSASVASGPFNGNIPGSANLPTGIATYTPNVGFSGVDTFTYFLRDSANHASDVRSVKVTVGTRPVPGDVLVRPILKNSTTANVINLGSSVTGLPNANILFSNITGVPFGNFSGVLHGTLSNKDRIKGKVTYRPAAGFSGEDHFSYTIADKLGYVQSATVTLDVIPFAVDDFFLVRAGFATPVKLDVLPNDSGIGSGTNKSIVSVFSVPGSPTTGTVAISSDNKFILYTPHGPPNTTDVFTYTMTDTSLPATMRPVSSATVTVSLTP